VRGERYLKSNSQFTPVYDEGKSWAGREIVLKALANKTNSTRFGFVISHRLGKAVVRNRIKRRLREITRLTPVQTGWDIIIIARVPAASMDYQGLAKAVKRLLLKAGMIVGENEGNRLRVN
jgi:ribonuclease P protein component